MRSERGDIGRKQVKEYVGYVRERKKHGKDVEDGKSLEVERNGEREAGDGWGGERGRREEEGGEESREGIETEKMHNEMQEKARGNGSPKSG